MIDFNVIKIKNITLSSIGLNINNITGLCKSGNKLYVTDENSIYVAYLDDLSSLPALENYEPIKIFDFNEQGIENVKISGISCDEDGNLYATSITSNDYQNSNQDLTKTVLFVIKKNQGVYVYNSKKNFQINKVINRNNESVSGMSLNQLDQLIGFEGVSYYKNNQLYLGFNKGYNGYPENSPYIIRCSTATDKITKKSEARFAKSITELQYVQQQNCIWLLDGESSMIHVCDSNAALINTINLKENNITFSFASNVTFKAMCVDYENKKIYLGVIDNGDGNGIYGRYLFEVQFEVKKIKITSSYFFKYAINRIMYGLNVIWTRITGCFSSGTWVKTSNWIKDEIWKNE